MGSQKVRISFGVSPVIVALIGGLLFVLGLVIPWLFSPWKVALSCERNQALCVLTREGLFQSERTEFGQGEITGARLDSIAIMGSPTGREEQIILTTKRGEVPFASYRIAARGFSASELHAMVAKINSYAGGNVTQIDVVQDIFLKILVISGLLIAFGALTMVLTIVGVAQSNSSEMTRASPW